MYLSIGHNLTFQSDPFLMLRSPDNYYGVPYVGNDRFEGYCVDLAEKISQLIKVDYKIVLVKDGRYGARNENGSWDGMMGELVRNVSGHGGSHVLGSV